MMVQSIGPGEMPGPEKRVGPGQQGGPGQEGQAMEWGWRGLGAAVGDGLH
jgi:hypothetical protein